MRYLSVAGDPLTVLLDGNETGGAYTVMEAILPPGGGPPPHVHSLEDEGFLVITGEVTFYLGDNTIVLKPGEYLSAPRGIPHHFVNSGSIEAIVLETATPAGIENFFAEVGTPIAGRNAERIPMTKGIIAKMIATAPKYGITMLVSHEK
jgi:quercetin dioxygenase-like cupin family protein